MSPWTLLKVKLPNLIGKFLAQPIYQLSSLFFFSQIMGVIGVIHDFSFALQFKFANEKNKPEGES